MRKIRPLKRNSIAIAIVAIAMFFVVASSAIPTYATDSGVNSKPTLKQLRDKYNDIGDCPIGLETFQTIVNVDAYTPGDYTSAANTYAQNYINFMRYQAGVGAITLEAALNANAAQGALIMARNEKFAHEQAVPTGISAAAAAPGQYATSASNISSMSSSVLWNMDIIESAILGQMKDERDKNLARVGHRRWLLAASTSTMGIGSALQDVKIGGWYEAYTAVRIMNKNATHNSSYGTVQNTNSTNYDYVAWPASGYMLNTVFDTVTPWSVMLNESKYSSIPDNVVVSVKRKSDNKTWTLDKNCTLVKNGSGYIDANYLTISNNNSSIVGEGHCLIFCPNPNELGSGKLTDEFDVSISNLKTSSGASTSLQYTVKFKDLEPNMSEMNITLNDSSKEYTGSPLTTTANVMYDSTRLTEGTDYTLSYTNNTTVGTAKVTITGKGKYKGSVEKTFSITPKKISAPTAVTGLTFNGNSQVGVVGTQDYSITNGAKSDAGNYTATAALNDKINTCWKDNSKTNRSISWSIAKATITNDKVQLVIPSEGFTYNGTTIEPNVMAKIGNREIDSSNYTITYNNNLNAAESTASNPPMVTIEGKNNCMGSVTVPFTIARKALSASMISGVSDYEFTGTSIEQDSLIVKDGNRMLGNNDYELTYSNNVNAGNDATVTVSGKGNYKSSIPMRFSITPKSVSGATLMLDNEEFVYDGVDKTPVTRVTLDGKTLTSGSDYTVAYENNINAGTAKTVVTGTGNYKDSLEGSFTINRKPLADSMIEQISDVTYNGSEQKPIPVVKDGTALLENGKDYTLSYSNNINAGESTASISGKGNYTGNASVKYKILAKNINEEDVEVESIPEQILERECVEPTVAVRFNGSILTTDDIDLVYENNTSEGIGSVSVIGKNNFTNRRTLNFKIISKERSSLKEFIATLEQDLNAETDDEFKAAIKAALDMAKAVAEDETADIGSLSDALTNAQSASDDAKAALQQKKEEEARKKAEEAAEKAAAAARAKKTGSDGTALGTGASAECAEKAILTSASDEGPKGSKFAPLALRSTTQTNKTITLTWTKNSKAKKYVIYGNVCGKKNKLKKLKTVTGKTCKITKISKALKRGTYHKFMVVALNANNNVISTSKVIHVATKGGKVGNHKSVTIKAKVNKNGKAIKSFKALTATKIKMGKSITIKTATTPVSKRLKVNKHRAVCYESSNTKIATVNAKGKITAKKKGTCYIFAYAQNGVFKKLKITVK